MDDKDDALDINQNEDLFKEITVEEDEYTPISEPFDPTLIDIDTRQPTISNIVDQIRNDEIDLSPAFQRSANLWDRGKQSRLIESILLRIPLPAFYFDVESKRDKNGIPAPKLHVIDGLQRLCSIKNFMTPDNTQEPLILENLEFLKNLNNRAYDELPRPYQRIISETQLIAYQIKPGTPENVKFNIFKRVNTGGRPLTQQEIRHALNQGIPSNFLKELAESIQFQTATRKKIDSRRMLDREFVNRFLAFYLLDFSEYQDLDTFLNKALKSLNELSDNKRDDIKSIFFNTLDTIYKIFGKYAFCKLDAYPKLKPINKVLFETLTVSVAKLLSEERETLQKKDCLKEYIKLFTEKNLTDLVSSSTSDKNRVKQRYFVIQKFLQEVIYA